MDKLIQLSDFFHISIDELVGHTSPEPASKAPETDTHRQPGKFTMFLTIGTMNTRADSRSSDSRWSTSMWEDGFPGRSSAAPGECLPSEMQRPDSRNRHSVRGNLIARRSLRRTSVAWSIVSGLLLACGGLSVGCIAIGGFAFGLFAVGGCAIGVYSIGGPCSSSEFSMTVSG